jgi:radical SAM superfamily enzyme YgiQ (UPF0313 family)
MKILLANSYYLAQDANERKIMKPYAPLGILYLSAVLKKADHEVRVFDSTFLAFSDFSRCLDGFHPDLVGIYGNIITRETALAMVQESRGKSYPVVAGGPDPTGEPAPYLEAGALAVVRGEGEDTLAALAALLDREGPGASLEGMPGLWIGGNGGAHATAPRERIDDLDMLPLPDREAIDLAQYIRAWKNKHGYSSLSLITSRGCPYQCKWCSKEIFGSLVRQRSPASAAEEIRHLCERYEPDQLWIADDVLTLNREWTLAFTDLVIKQGSPVPFECLSRVDRIDEEIADGLRRAGCFRIWYGAESGSVRVIENMKKDFTRRQIRQSVHLTKKAGIQAGLFILIGYPGERLIDLLKTLMMIRDLAPHYCGSSVAFPIKGTPFFEDVKDILMPGYAWSRRNENRSAFRGRYPSLFYWFAVRLVNNWSAFWRAGDRRDSAVKRAAQGMKCIVAGAAVLAIGGVYELKHKLFPDPLLLSKEGGASQAVKGKRG